MFNLSGSEIIVILLLALVVLGPEKLPDALRRAGRTYAELKKMGNSFQEEVRSVLDEPVKEMRETADLLRTSVTDTTAAITGTTKTTAPTTPPATSPRATLPATAKLSAAPPAREPPAPDEELINRTLSGGGRDNDAAAAEATPAADEHPTR